MVWSTGGSVTDSILRYRDIGHVIYTLSCDTSFVVIFCIPARIAYISKKAIK